MNEYSVHQIAKRGGSELKIYMQPQKSSNLSFTQFNTINAVQFPERLLCLLHCVHSWFVTACSQLLAQILIWRPNRSDGNNLENSLLSIFMYSFFATHSPALPVAPRTREGTLDLMMLKIPESRNQSDVPFCRMRGGESSHYERREEHYNLIE